MHAHIVEPCETCRECELIRGHGYVRDVEKEIGTWTMFLDDKPKKVALKPLSQPVRTSAKVVRNDPCPYGSCKKYKKCHGQT
jgi:hypothetical protein